MPTTKVNQRLVRLDAIRQADDRAAREGVPCLVFRRVGFPTTQEVTWYVRTQAEGAPEGCGTPEYTATPYDGADELAEAIEHHQAETMRYHSQPQD